MSAEPRGPSGTGHDTAGWVGLQRPTRVSHAPEPDPPVAVPGPASEPICPGCKRPVSECQAEDVYEVVDAPGPASVSPSEPPEAADERGAAETRAAKWKPFVLLHTVIEQSESSLRTEALIVLEQLRQRVEDGEALGDA